MAEAFDPAGFDISAITGAGQTDDTGTSDAHTTPDPTAIKLAVMGARLDSMRELLDAKLATIDDRADGFVKVAEAYLKVGEANQRTVAALIDSLPARTMRWVVVSLATAVGLFAAIVKILDVYFPSGTPVQ